MPTKYKSRIDAEGGIKIPAGAGLGYQFTSDANGVGQWTAPSGSAIPAGAAGGDLGGTYPNPTVLKGQAGMQVAGGLVVAGRISGVVDPTAAQEAATKNYVDSTAVEFLSGVYTSRPAAGTAGRVYSATDTGGVYYDRGGSSWVTLSPPYIASGNPLPTAGVGNGDEVHWQTGGGNVLWHCRYDSSIGDAYKWWVLGGGPAIYALADGVRQVVNTTTYAALATDPITLTIPTPGIYDITVEGTLWSNASGLLQGILSYTVGATAASDTWGIFVGMAVMQASCAATRRHTFPGPTLTCAERARVTGTMTVQYTYRRLIARPVRISA